MFFPKFYKSSSSNSCTGLLQAQKFPGSWGSVIVKQLAHKDGKIVSPLDRPTLPLMKLFWYLFVSETGANLGPGRIRPTIFMPTLHRSHLL